MKRTLAMFACCTAVACGGKTKSDPPPAPPALQLDGDARLAPNVVPTHYTLDLTIDPAQEQFSGRVQITAELAEATNAIMLHAEELTIIKATVSQGSTQVPADVQTGPNGGLGLAFTNPLAAGEVQLDMQYTGPLDEVPAGLYRVKDGEAWYAFTQFEPLEARQAFPSFDEPGFKTPFDVTLRVPTGQKAFANTPEVSRSTEGDLDVVKFATSKPLPTYLVAFAAGPLDVLEAEPIDGVPLRLIATAGKAEKGAWILEQTPAFLRALTDYFGEPYPYEKLDLVAVPNFAAGAMENVGLVTFRETGLLLDDSAPIRNQAGALSTLGHELAHMWFGNLVTLPWWDEIWLNEGFATWMAAKILHQLHPEFESNLFAIRSNGWVMGADSLTESQAIEQDIRNRGDVYGAFSGISYGKGRAVLDMFEAWLGDEVMRDAVRHYLAKHPHGTGSTASLLASLDEVSKKPVSESFATFTNQPGAPLLAFKTTCEAAPSVTIAQSRFLPSGSEAKQTGPWNVPVCVSWREGKEDKTHCELATGATSTFALPTETCPKWIYPNAGQAGYYRWSLEAEALGALLAPKTFATLDTATKLETFSNLTALSQAEAVDAKQYVAAVERLLAEGHHALARQAIGALGGIENAVPDEELPKFRKRAKALLARHLRKVGLEGKEGESTQVSLLRPTVVSASASIAEDAATIAWAKKIADAFAKDMSSVPLESVQLALPVAAKDADASKWLSYKLLLTNVKDPLARRATLNALGSVRDPQLLERSLDLFFTDDVRAQDMWSLLGPAFGDEATNEVMWIWFTKNYDAVVEKVGEHSFRSMPALGSGFCTPEGAEKVKTFFSDPAHQTDGTDRKLSEVLEEIDQCQRRREYLRAGLSELY